MEVERPFPRHRQEDAAGAESAQGELPVPPDTRNTTYPPEWRGQVSSEMCLCHVIISLCFSDQQIQADMNLRVTIIDEAHDNKIYNLTFPGSHTVVQVTGSVMKTETHVIVTQVKRDVATVTDIPVFRQSWTGDYTQSQ